ncbi:DUF1826 domain-containing protein [Falsiroseomonas oryzae]|uniref:DUF1826 domain-containing protein n=1 Tax=Falsiroseomonas oryzae TaxID=2766473 RepID=UPI0022EB40B6|nr:DUF1826 domain-containing protein [Roseomonas sp. MO-31]
MAGLMLEALPEAGIAPPLHPDTPPRRRPVAVSGAEPEILRDVLRPEVNLAIWHRDLATALTAGLRPLADAAPFTAVAEDDPERAVEALAAKLPATAPLDLLLDICRLARTFAAIVDTGGAVRIRLEAITGPACHRWHADAVGLRLLCTYRGAGTEWLPIAGGARAARGIDPKALPCERSRVATGAAAILKGEGFRGNAGFGCIHRSPPAGPGERARLLLCLDEPGRIPLE